MHRATAIVTGAGSGIGRAVAISLAERGVQVMVVGRREEALKSTVELAKARGFHPIDYVSADITTVEGRLKIKTEFDGKFGGGLQFLIHNAGSIGVTKHLMDEEVTVDAFREILNVNVEAPLFMTKDLLPLMTEGSRVLHVSSGAAHSAIEGWGSYCISKAAFFMMYKMLALELRKTNGVLVGSVKPGKVDTPMQGVVRAADPAHFPLLDSFVSLKKAMPEEVLGSAGHVPPSDMLDTPENVARFISFLLMETGGDEFTESEWDIRDAHHQHRWHS